MCFVIFSESHGYISGWVHRMADARLDYQPDKLKNCLEGTFSMLLVLCNLYSSDICLGISTTSSKNELNR